VRVLPIRYDGTDEYDFERVVADLASRGSIERKSTL
jgi:hypothetical protein